MENSIHGILTIKNCCNYDKWNVNCSKKGSYLREDFVNLVKKYNPQLKEIVNETEIVWEKSQGFESDEVTADLELKIRNIKGAVDILASASAKEMAYKTVKKNLIKVL